MPTSLTAHERETLFRTPIVTRQIHRYVNQHPGVSRAELNEVFASVNNLSGRLIDMVDTGVLKKEYRPEYLQVHPDASRCKKHMRRNSLEGRIFMLLKKAKAPVVRREVLSITRSPSERKMFPAAILRLKQDNRIRLIEAVENYWSLRENVPGSKADGVWQTARAMGTFTTIELARQSGASLEYITTICQLWFANGHINRIGSDHKAPLYRIITRSVVRPRCWKFQSKEKKNEAT